MFTRCSGDEIVPGLVVGAELEAVLREVEVVAGVHVEEENVYGNVRERGAGA